MDIFLTGTPGSGKSTVLMKVINILKRRGLKVGGFITPEIRSKGKRTGFKVIDINSGDEGILSSINRETGPQVGKYRVDLEDFERVALKALDFSTKECDIICIDELGTMELLSQKFKEKIEEILDLDKTIIIVLHRNLVPKYKNYGKIFYVTPNNRDGLPEKIIGLIENGSTQSRTGLFAL
jgi:nucleoside-triphosphatase